MVAGTVRTGLRMIIAALSAFIVATFFSDRVADMLRLSPLAETGFIFICFFAGGICGGFGLIVALFGVVRNVGESKKVRLMPTMMMLVAVVLLFCALILSHQHTPKVPRLRPGETIVI